MKRFFLLSVILLILINGIPTEAQAQGPTVTIVPPSGTQTGAFDVTIEFSEGVNGFVQGDITLEPNSLASLTGFTGNDGDTTYTAEITPTTGEQGTLTIDVASNVAETASSEQNQAGSAMVEVDAKVPTVMLSSTSEDKTSAFDVTITFSEPVNGFEEDDIAFEAGIGSVQSLTANDDRTIYTARIQPKATGNLKIKVPANVATDAVGNGNRSGNTLEVSVDLPHAIMVMEPEGEGPYNEAFDVVIMFTESVESGFGASDITLSPSGLAMVMNVTGSAPTYTATIMPADRQDGDLGIQVEANAVQDAAATPVSYPASNEVTVMIDTVRPTVESIDVPSDPQSSAFDVTITFSEGVYDFDVSEIQFGGGVTATASLKSGDAGGSEYVVTITPTSSGDLTIEVDGDAAEDAAGNGNARSDQETVTIDVNAPTVTISNAPVGPEKDAFDVTITFDKTVEDFGASAVTLSPSGLASVTRVTGSGASYTATITPEDDEQGDLMISVAAGAVQDAAGNGNDASNTVTVTVDKKKPTITFSGIPNTPQNSAFDITITFSENVTGFLGGDIIRSPNNLVNVGVSGSGDTYTVTITPGNNQEGDVEISVAANAVTDTAGNSNNASRTETLKVDKLRPRVSFSGIPNTPTKDAFTVTITFSEPVTDVAIGDFYTSPTGFVTLSNLTGSDNTATRQLTLTPGANKDGTVSFGINSMAARDAAGNTSRPGQSSIDIDTAVPTVTITGAPAAKQKDPFDVTFTFSEEVNGFEVPDGLTVTGPATASLKSGNEGDSVYVVTITPNANRNGIVTLGLRSGTVTDLAGNTNDASSTHSFTIDTKKPTISFSNIPHLTSQNSAFDITITFSENVGSFGTGDITLTPSGLATVGITGNDPTYTVTITPLNNQQGNVTIKVEAGAVQDTAGNDNEASDTITVAVDKKKPTISSFSGFPNSPTKNPFTVTITFSEPVKGFHMNELQASPSSFVTRRTPSGNPVEGNNTDTRQIIFTPVANKDGNVTFAIPAGVLTDRAGNSNETSSSQTVRIDTVVPTVTSITGLPATEQKGPFDVTVTFSEDVTGFAADDVAVTGEATVTNVGSPDADNAYILTITPNASKEGDVTLQVKANAVTDTAGNPNTDASTVTAAIHIDTIVPTVTSITGVPPITEEQNSPFEATVFFSEAVKGFAAEDVTVTGPARVTDVDSPDDNEYILTITPNPTSEGGVTLQVKVNAVTDAAGNANTASAVTSAIHIDTMVPTVEFRDLPTTEQNGLFYVTVLFSEDVNDFAAGDVTVTGEARVTRVLNPGPDEYILGITPNDGVEGDVTLQVKANAVTDAAGNANDVSDASGSVHIDTIVPTVTISAPPTAEQKDPFDLTITFTEPVNGFAVPADLTVRLAAEPGVTSATPIATATLTSGTAGASVYTVTITPNAAGAEGNVTVQVNANTVTDNAGNSNTAASAVTAAVHVDTIVPTVTISAPPTAEQKDPFDLTITFSEEVKGFATDDVTVTGPASATSASGSDGDTVYTVTITPDANEEGDVTVTVNADTVQDFALNDNTASPVSDTVHVDTIIPTVTISAEPDIEKNVPFDLTITFSEEVNGFATDDVKVEGPASATSASGSDGDTVYTVTITPDATSEGDVTVTVNADTVQDFALNDNTASPVSDTVHVDTIIPTVTISAEPDIEKNVPFDLTITFSEEVNGFATDDVTVTGPASATSASGNDGDTIYTVTITPNATSEGDVTVTVNADTVQDFALNDNTASPVSDTVHVDTIIPTVTISAEPDIEKNVPFDLTITFSEEVNGFATDDVTVTGPASATSASGNDGDTIYTVTITPNATSEGDVTVTVNADTVQDFALNDNTASPVSDTVHVDTIIPTVTISAEPDIEKNVPFDLTITFSEEVNGFATDDVTVTGPASATSASGNDGDTIYTVTITPNATSEGDVTVTVNAAGVQDFALNGNTASSVSETVHVDTIIPTVTISDEPTTVENETEVNADFVITITFSEEVNGFAVPADLTLTGPATASLTTGGDGDSVYTVTITPDADVEDDEVTVTVDATTVQDFALNDNTASPVSETVHIDTIRPTALFENVPTLEKRNDVFDITVVFHERVRGFEVPGDLIIDGPVTASLASGSDGDEVYTVTITPDENARGDVTFQVDENIVEDVATNGNGPSEETNTVRIDTVPPVAEITNLPTITGAPFDITITFNEQVNGFTTEDIALTGPATALLKSGVDGDEVYIATITPNPNSRGDVHIQIPAGVVKDLALNDNIASEITPAIHVDTNALTVQITDVPETVQLEAFSVMIKFSMDVADFALADITISGDAVIQSSELTGRGKVYMLKITPEANTDGDVIIQVPADVATDAASNRNAASIPQTVSVAPNWLPDEGIRDAVREGLGLPEGEDFEQVRLEDVTTLTVESSDISTLTGLEAATNLTTLDLSGNAITDITVLENLTALTTLDLGGNAITDITVLENLTELTTLDLSGNAITDIKTLAELTELTVLDLGGNAITNITSLSGLTKLTSLNLSDNPISSLNPLTTLTALTTLGLSGNSISDLTVISGLTGLLVLDLSDNAITDITLLGNLTALTTLDLSGNTVSTLTPLTTLTQLTTLNLNNNTVSDLTALGGLTTLTTLELAGNAISTLAPIATLQQLRVLDLSDNTISDVNTLASLANLTTLRLMGNPILDTTALYALTQRVPPVDIDIAVSQYTPWDVNADGSVDAADSALVTAALGQTGDGILDPRTDVNGDGTVDNADLLLVTENFDEVQGAPTVADILRLLDPATVARLDREVLQAELQRLVLDSDGSLKYRRAIELLQRVLAVKHPDQTRLFTNYPNPFNPETWIPYQLAVGSNVEITIYDVKGVVVRHLKLGHQPAGYYTQKSGAAYWDGRNAVGERVASGVYFYQLQADNVSLLRKMVILK